MEKLGRVEKIYNNTAEIRLERDSACGENCAACGLCPNREMKVTLPCPAGLCVGDEVKLLSDDSAFVKKTVWSYLSLTLLLLLGGVVGALLKSQWLAFILAIAFVGIGILLIRRLSPKGVEIHIEKLTR